MGPCLRDYLRVLTRARARQSLMPSPEGTDITDTLLPALFGVSEVRLGDGGDDTVQPAWRLDASVTIGE